MQQRGNFYTLPASQGGQKHETQHPFLQLVLRLSVRKARPVPEVYGNGARRRSDWMAGIGDRCAALAGISVQESSGPVASELYGSLVTPHSNLWRSERRLAAPKKVAYGRTSKRDGLSPE